MILIYLRYAFMSVMLADCVILLKIIPSTEYRVSLI